MQRNQPMTRLALGTGSSLSMLSQIAVVFVFGSPRIAKAVGEREDSLGDI